MSELKPCPFCGCDLVTRYTGWLDHPKAKCILSGKVFHKGFIGQWNRRADLPTTLSAAMQLPEVKALVEAFKDQNELMRSALEIAKREGINGEIGTTNWDAYYNKVAVSLKRSASALAAIKEPKT